MSQLFEKRDRWGNRFSLWIILGAIFLTPLCAWSLRQTRVENDIENWLPENDPNAVTLRWSTGNFGLDAGDSILVSWDDSSLADPRLDKLAQKLEGKPDEHGVRRGGVKQVSRVVTPRDLVIRMTERGVSRDEAIRRLKGVLVGAGMYKIRLTEAGRLQQKEVDRELKLRAKQELGLDLQTFPPARDYESQEDEPVAEVTPNSETTAEPKDATANESVAATDVAVPAPTDVPQVEFDLIPQHDFQVRWKDMLHGDHGEAVTKLALSLRGPKTSVASEGEALIEDCFQWIGSPVAVSVQLNEAGEAEKAKTMELIRQAAVSVGVPEKQLRLGGRPVAATALNEGVKAAVWNRSADKPWKRSVIGLSGIVGALAAFTMLRSLKLSALVLFVSYFTVFVTVALVPPTGGTMNMVMVLMPTFLLVVVMSGAIHVAHYWRHAAFQNHPNPVSEAVRLAAEPCTIATVTTAIGLLSLMTSDLRPVRDFGLYSAIGSFVGLAAVLYLLPAMIQILPFKPPKPDEVDASKWEDYGRWCHRKRHWIVWSYTLVTLACCVGLKWFRTETKVIRYFPADAPVVQSYWFLEENLAGIVPVDVVVRFDQSCQANPDFNFLDRLELVRTLENKLRAHPDISGTLSLPDFRPVSEKPAADAGFLAKGRYAKSATEMERRIKETDVAGAKSFFVVAKEASDLKRPGDALLNQPNDELWRITSQCFVMSETNFSQLVEEVNETARSVLKSQAGASHVVTGMVPVFLQTQQALLNSQISSFGVAYLTVWLVMIFAVRHIGGGFLTMLPNVYPIGQIFGLISLFSLPVDIGTMMTASIAMGIGVDGTLHKVHWFRQGIRQGRSREDAIALAVGQSGPAIWETSAVLTLGMLMLLPSELLLISRFGWMMAAIIFVAVAGDILLTPALLGGLLGTWLMNHEQTEPPEGGLSSAVNSSMGLRKEPTVPPAPHLLPPSLPSSQPAVGGH